MFTGSMIIILLLFFVIFIVIYKRDMLRRTFSLNITTYANEFQEQLEQTTDVVIKRLETQIAHLEYLLEEADTKIDALDKQIQNSDTILKQYSVCDTTKIESLNPPTVDSGLEMTIRQPAINLNVAIPTVSSLQEEDLRDRNKETVHSDKRRLILAMAEQGYNVTEIARATGIGKGEIMLLLQLNKK